MLINLLCSAVPYLTIGLGLLIFRNAWVAILTYHLGIAAVIFFTRQVVPIKKIIRSSIHKPLIFPVVIGVSGGVVLYLLWPLLSVLPDINTYLQSIGLTDITWPYFMVYYALVNPVFEEYYWRGYLGSNSKRPVLNDFFFSGYHVMVMAGKADVFWLIAVFLAICGVAWYWRQISRITGGLMTATLSHMAGDITVILSIYLRTIAV